MKDRMREFRNKRLSGWRSVLLQGALLFALVVVLTIVLPLVFSHPVAVSGVSMAGVSATCSRDGCWVTNNSGQTVGVCGASNGCEGRMDSFCGPTWPEIASGQAGSVCVDVAPNGQATQIVGRAQVNCGSWQTDVTLRGALENSGLAADHGVDTSNCAPPTHRVCQNLACVVVTGVGTNGCTVDNDCSHRECQNNACLRVAGPGLDRCNADSDCRAAQTAVCDNLTVSPMSGTAPLSVDASLSGHTENGGSIVSFRFNFGDGTGDFSQSGTSLSHTYLSSGTFVVNGFVIDNLGNQSGGSGNCQKVVTVGPKVVVTPPPPQIPRAGAETLVLMGLAGSGIAGAVMRRFRSR